ncbi:hypothetical protein BS50DRAFT_577408 [Corynespora cassiicola Philippines]|uniref:LDB19 N-terminal domain-containing protein n=1 Tax=Corynespora cassiicola Philippines TaxID=1448308 RepID=A0A2T2NAM9_CORCC|nr:hypothetical protein BS50DRAFT_577408 [Corynespora cassiicola Philippines]
MSSLLPASWAKPLPFDNDLSGKHHHHHTRSIMHKLHMPKSSSKPNSTLQSPAVLTPPATASDVATIDIVEESPYIVFYDTPANSTGALFAGRLSVNAKKYPITLVECRVRLLLVSTATSSTELKHHTTEIHKWNLVESPSSSQRAHYEFPFSCLLPGHLPTTTTNAKSFALGYRLEATATTAAGDVITSTRNVDAKRILRPSSRQDFFFACPPTDMFASVKFPAVVQPSGDFFVNVRLSNIFKNKKNWQTRWRLREIKWRIEEVEKHASSAPQECDKSPRRRRRSSGAELGQELVRVIGRGEVTRGWSYDFEQGNVDVGFAAKCDPDKKPVLDVDYEGVAKVEHRLVMEMIVYEEQALKENLGQAIPIGGAHALKTHHSLVIAEQSESGLSWDEEGPPMYEDDGGSPPTYLDGDE